MARLHYFIGKHFPEICALFACACVLAVGARLAWESDPLWLNRAGALIVIIGVLLAASRFHEWLAQKAADSIQENRGAFSEHVLRAYERRVGKSLSEEERAGFLSVVKDEWVKKDEITEHLVALIAPDQRRLKLWEIYLVIGGTFLNGFGDYIISLLKGGGV